MKKIMKSPKLSSPRTTARSPKPRRQFDRRSAEGNLRSPKRNGAGGSFVWGTIMDQEGPIYVDRNDPNYDSDADGDGFVLEELNLTQLKKDMQGTDDQKNENVGMATSPPMGKGPGSDSGDSSASSTANLVKKNEGSGGQEKKAN